MYFNLNSDFGKVLRRRKTTEADGAFFLVDHNNGERGEAAPLTLGGQFMKTTSHSFLYLESILKAPTAKVQKVFSFANQKFPSSRNSFKQILLNESLCDNDKNN